MWESVEESKPTTSLPYGLLLSQILVDRLIDLSKYIPFVINATYNSRTFSSMGYVEVGNKWVKKDSVQEWAKADKPSKISVDQQLFFLRI